MTAAAACKKVADAYGAPMNTLRNWEFQLPKQLGPRCVSEAIADARIAGDVARKLPQKPGDNPVDGTGHHLHLEFTETPDHEAGARYQEALRDGARDDD